MTTIIIFGAIFVAAYLLQSFLTFQQIRSFNHSFAELKQLGKVVTGKKSGRLIAGTVMMFAIDENGIILDGKIMQGISVFARIKPYKTYNGQALITLDKNHDLVKTLHPFKKKALEDARTLYIKYLTGTLEDDNYTWFTPFGLNFKKKKR